MYRSFRFESVVDVSGGLRHICCENVVCGVAVCGRVARNGFPNVAVSDVCEMGAEPLIEGVPGLSHIL